MSLQTTINLKVMQAIIDDDIKVCSTPADLQSNIDLFLGLVNKYAYDCLNSFSPVAAVYSDTGHIKHIKTATRIHPLKEVFWHLKRINKEEGLCYIEEIRYKFEN